ncbi:hypothetical protein [Longitalea luteola]|uniref:hypothetical protein n=1 Tax=Longitalea luteola TaxID=2812563 RepID=UPI001A9567D5|nr:hypothetical protein [Longitalea luteola]
MQKLVLYSALFLLGIAACSKDKYQSKPTIEIKSIGPNPVPLNFPLTIDLEYTDKEGDITDSIFVRKIRINQKKVARTLRDSFALQLPGDVPEKTKGTIRLTFDYQGYVISAEDPGSPPNAAPDSLIFQFVLQDKAKNISDTVESGLIVVERQQ